MGYISQLEHISVQTGHISSAQLEATILDSTHGRAKKWGQTLPKQFPAVGVSPTLPCQNAIPGRHICCHLRASTAKLWRMYCAGPRPSQKTSSTASCRRCQVGLVGQIQSLEELCLAPGVFLKSLEVVAVFMTGRFFPAPTDTGAGNPRIRPQFLKSGSPGCLSWLCHFSANNRYINFFLYVFYYKIKENNTSQKCMTLMRQGNG